MNREIECFVNSLILSSGEGREPMTIDAADQSIQEWKNEGMEDIPNGLTAEILTKLWNEGI